MGRWGWWTGRCALPALAIAAAALSSPAAQAAAPPGATARCWDGSYSFSHHRSGTCSHHGGVAVWLAGGGSGGASGSTPVAVGATVLLANRTRTGDCHRRPEPDRRCSPGAYYGRLTQAVLCSAGFRTGSIRNVPQTEKFAVEREYGLPAAYYGRSIEIDHIVPLELGGSNAIANLFPEPGSGAADYHVKDRLENRLHELVCADRLGLAAARHEIGTDWEATYDHVFGVEPTG